jgi:hypothetical protein
MGFKAAVKRREGSDGDMKSLLKVAITIGLLGLQAHVAPAASGAQASHELKLNFDGGFAYIFSKGSGTVDVVSIKKTPQIPEHRLKLAVANAASFDKMASTVKPKKTGEQFVWDLTGWDAVVLPGGNPVSNAPVTIPPTAAVQTCGQGVAEPTGSAANNLGYVADVGALAGTNVLDDSAVGARLKLSSGTLALVSVGYCWQFEAGAEKRPATSLLRGVNGLVYTLPNDQPFVDIGLRRPGDTSIAKRIRLLPGADGSIRARLSTWFGATTGPTSVKPGEIDHHFAMFYRLLKPEAAARAGARYMPRFMPGFTVAQVTVSPGDDCVSGRIMVP